MSHKLFCKQVIVDSLNSEHHSIVLWTLSSGNTTTYVTVPWYACMLEYHKLYYCQRDVAALIQWAPS